MRNGFLRKALRLLPGLLLWALISIFPVYWMLTFSLKNNNEIFGENVAGLPREWVWANYTRAFHTGNMPRYFLNSLVVAITTIIITLSAAVMATYAITRLRWKGRKRMNSFFMLGLTIPIHASIVPLYTTLAKIKLLGRGSPVGLSYRSGRTSCSRPGN